MVDEHSPWDLERFEGQSSWNFSDLKHPLYHRLIEKAKAASDENCPKILLSEAK